MTTYREAGVDIEGGDEFVKRIASRARTTFRKEVIGGLGGFGGLFRFPSERFKEPVLVSGTDGVGTKLKIAQLVGRHNTIGIDLVAMCVNDICVGGAEPLFFLDYLATGKLDVSIAESIVEGIVTGCQEAGCALIGGETAEMPSCYPDGEYDLAGFAVGVVERANIVDGSRIEVGDVLIGLPSTGLHSNGYTLARQVLLNKQGWTIDTRLEELTHSLGETLLEPTRIYAKAILSFLSNSSVHGMAHITGGGLTGNLPRILPQQCQAAVKYKSWPIQPIFQIIQQAGNIEQQEMLRVFNMGIGLVLIVPPAEVNTIQSMAKEFSEPGYLIGEIRKRAKGSSSVCFVE
jgi:phosphoribosylformylglycinamidine cyclo-ligase